MTAPPVVNEDPLDVELLKDPGMIERGPTASCRHNARSKCSSCLPLDPFDPAYLQEKELKHMSFHAYVKKVSGRLERGRSSALSYPLEAPVCRVKPCSAHPPYPAATCVKCLPDPIILARQPYRHVDNVVFESPDLVDRFLDGWRESGGAQRIGILLGRYERHPDVPLGIRANVVAIWEPPQTSTRDAVRMEPWWAQHSLTAPAADPATAHKTWLDRLEGLVTHLHLRPLGWLVTDLVQVDGGKFHYSRDAHRSFLVSAQECITAAALQNRFPNATKLSATGAFGSKFVTVIVSADREGAMEFRGWQMSNQAGALAEDGWMVPTVGTPDMASVRSDRLCVPDVKYSAKDKYGNSVMHDARPFPVEYLLVDVPAGAGKSGEARTFNPLSPARPAFPASNRQALGHPQTLAHLAQHIAAFAKGEELGMVTDVNLLHFLAENEAHRVPPASLALLCEGIRAGDSAAVTKWLAEDPDWAQLSTLATEAKDQATQPTASGSGGSSAGSGGGGAEWACAHCTFHNPATATDCSICGLPRNA